MCVAHNQRPEHRKAAEYMYIYWFISAWIDVLSNFPHLALLLIVSFLYKVQTVILKIASAVRCTILVSGRIHLDAQRCIGYLLYSIFYCSFAMSHVRRGVSVTSSSNTALH